MAPAPTRGRMKFFNRSLPKSRVSCIVPPFGHGARNTRQQYKAFVAAVAQLVERNLAKVEVESSRLFCRSSFPSRRRHAGGYSTEHCSCSSVAEHSLGKGEVGSSILPMSTTRLAKRPAPLGTGLFAFTPPSSISGPARQGAPTQTGRPKPPRRTGQGLSPPVLNAGSGSPR